jgi:hypothetical protein
VLPLVARAPVGAESSVSSSLLLAWDHALARAVLGVFVRVLLGFLRHRARLYRPRLFRGGRLEPSRAACGERPHVAIPRETDHFHLAGGSRA